MNIVYFVAILDQLGGAERATWQLAEQMASRGHRVTILTTRALRQSQFPFIDYTKGFRVIRLPVWQHSPASFQLMLRVQSLWASPILLRHTHIFQARGLTPETNTLAQIAHRFGASTICVPMASGALGDAANYHGAISFDHISALAEPIRQEVISRGFPAQRTTVIPNGVDSDFFSPAAHPIKEPQVVYVGQFRPEKHVDLLLSAWQRLQDIYPPARLALVGGGHLRRAYEEHAAAVGLRVSFIPDTDSAGVLAYLRQNSIFALAGTAEGMSNALLEAMAVGLAPVVADTPANRVLVSHEANGLAYEADSPDALAQAFARLIDDVDLRLRLGAAARKTVLARYTLNSVTEQYLALYAELLGETR